MCFLYQKTLASLHLAGVRRIPLTPAQQALRPFGLPEQDASLLHLDAKAFRLWTPDEGERSCSPRPHKQAAFRPCTPHHGGDFALPLDPHRLLPQWAGPESVPPSPAPSFLTMAIEATVAPVDYAGAREAAWAIGKEMAA